MWICGLTAALLLFFTSLTAGEVLSVNADHKNGIYFLEFSARLAVDHDSVYDTLIDYEHLTRLSDSIVESTVINPHESGTRTRTVTKTCIVFFCFSATIVEEVEEIGKESVITTIVPELSDFKFGKTLWHIQEDGPEQTLIQYKSSKQPAFWVPPLIGPWVIKNRMIKETEELISRLESIARHE